MKKFTTYGSVCSGCGHSHRSFESALKCLRSNQQGCRIQGGYSDRSIYEYDPNNANHEPIPRSSLGWVNPEAFGWRFIMI